MKRARGTQVYLLALVLVGLTGMLIGQSWMVRCAFLCVILASGYMYWNLEARRLGEASVSKLSQERRDAHHELIAVVNRLRHDWMNDAQILFGYIQMKKFDNLRPYMEKIKLTMQQESNLSKLGIPSLIAYLLQFRVKSKTLELHVDIEQEINLGQLPLPDGLIESLIRQVVACVQESITFEDGESGTLSLEFDLQEDSLLLDFVYQGPYERERLEQSVATQFASEGNQYLLENEDWHEEEASITLRLPFHI
ncbi:Spo0B domain-containing protein [Paenibacillus roseipurpureus]|uniref:Spo0B domain-containing protein n=1 Tax=Paenibacillus roseopurpureus TaxID=2918901 RepID=A0AA96LRA8_9BACL|nr:Spo0B domain-containing protein [Paenibacillus sp. MBLB1832]WNR45856.1 Spo0B domain-containing protein [Paenibacillus sp. MBLB1832]